MPTIHDEPPVDVQKDLNSLSTALDAAIPPKIPEFNLLIATWNLRMFGSLTRKMDCNIQ